MRGKSTYVRLKTLFSCRNFMTMQYIYLTEKFYKMKELFIFPHANSWSKTKTRPQVIQDGMKLLSCTSMMSICPICIWNCSQIQGFSNSGLQPHLWSQNRWLGKSDIHVLANFARKQEVGLHWIYFYHIVRGNTVVHTVSC